MATALWVRAIRHQRIVQQTVIPCTRIDPTDALEKACHEMDISVPLWLEKNGFDWDEFGQTRFLPDAFMDEVPFDRLEIEFIDPDAPKKRSKDPRNG